MKLLHPNFDPSMEEEKWEIVIKPEYAEELKECANKNVDKERNNSDIILKR